jgi:hypothetical protein
MTGGAPPWRIPGLGRQVRQLVAAKSVEFASRGNEGPGARWGEEKCPQYQKGTFESSGWWMLIIIFPMKSTM